MDKTTRKNITSSKRKNWRTPPEFKVVLDKLARVGLDPCGHKHSIMKAKKQYLLKERGENGLKLTWRGHGLVFVNPPYTRKIRVWFEKLLRELERDATLECVFLVAARTETKWYQKFVFGHAQAICYTKGRYKFLGPTKSGKRVGAMFPSAVVYYGRRPSKFKEVFGETGHVELLTDNGARVIANLKLVPAVSLGKRKAA